MRKFIIDTDTGSDDAAALMLAAAAQDIDILGVTTVSGNVHLKLATANALQTLETSGADVSVYPGADCPLFRKLVTADSVHGKDGMGDQDLVHPTRLPEKKHAVEFILETIAAYPGEVEIVALGPVTNLALAYLKDRGTMKKVKHIWSMGTGGFGPGNATPVAEFNVYVDADSYAILLESGIPITIIGFDLCLGPAALKKEDLDTLAAGGPTAKLAANCTKALLAYNLNSGVGYSVDLPDAVAMGVALWPDIVLETVEAYCYCCTKEEPSYGQAIVYDKKAVFSVELNIPEANAAVVKTIDHQLFKERLMKALLTGKI